MLAKLEFLWVFFEFDRTWFLNIRLTMPKVHEEIISEVREKPLYWKFWAPLENSTWWLSCIYLSHTLVTAFRVFFREFWCIFLMRRDMRLFLDQLILKMMHKSLYLSVSGKEDLLPYPMFTSKVFISCYACWQICNNKLIHQKCSVYS